MKILVCCLGWMMLFLGANAQQLQFRNFKELNYGSQYLHVWLAPLDIEQKFKPFQQEVKKNGLIDVGSYKYKREVDSLVCARLKRRGIDPKEYLKGSDHPLVPWLNSTLSSKVENPFPLEWLRAMPSTLKTSLEERAENERLPYMTTYFVVYALVNNQGKVLTVYFSIDATMLDLIREEDLQSIYDAIMETPFNPDNFEFRYADQKVMEATVKKLLNQGMEMTYQERRDLANEAIKPVIPAVHGVIECICLYSTRPFNFKGEEMDPANWGRFAPAIPTEKAKK